MTPPASHPPGPASPPSRHPHPTGGDIPPALSIHQPAASLLAAGWLKTQLRGWSTPRRGAVLIHASRGLDARDHALWASQRVRAAWHRLVGPLVRLEDAPRGCLVGLAELTGCQTASSAFGPQAAVFVGPNDDALGAPGPRDVVWRFERARTLTRQPYCPGGPGLFAPAVGDDDAEWITFAAVDSGTNRAGCTAEFRPQ